MAALLNHVSLLSLRGAAHLHLLVTDVVTVLLIRVHFVGVVALARHATSLACCSLSTVLVPIIQHAVLLKLDLLEWLLTGMRSCSSSIISMTGEVLTAGLVASFVDLGDLLSALIRLIYVGVHVAVFILVAAGVGGRCSLRLTMVTLVHRHLVV